jgi:hypothetical protein
MEVSILCNGNKSVANYIMGAHFSLTWAQCKRRTLLASMGCVHTHRRIPTIEGCGSPNCIRNVVEKDGENNRKVGKDG